jgi:glycosyltransferase involved in cell wall biosynthesis
VSDLWPESAEKLGVVTNPLLLRFAYRLEERLYKSAVLVTGQTKGICQDIQKRFPSVPTYWLPNGVDLSYYDPALAYNKGWRAQNGIAEDQFVFLYAGIIGIAQGLEVILGAAKQLSDEKKLRFVLLGSGPEKPRLKQLTNSMNLNNVLFLDAVTKKEMPSVLASVNASIIPLKKLDLFKGAIPSKIFETLSMQIPILLGVDGEARQLFIEEGRCGLYFEPENAESLYGVIKTLMNRSDKGAEFGINGRRFVSSHFNRETIAAGFYRILSQLNDHVRKL